MDKLTDYIKVYPWLDKELCDQIRKEIEEATWKQHVFYNAEGKYVTQSGDQELDVSWDNIATRDKLTDYIKVYPWLDKELCDQVRKEIDEATWKQHVFYNADGKYVTQSGEQELDVSWDNIATRDKLTQKVWEAISQYILTDFKNDYFNGWQGFTHIRFNRYREGKTMAKHCDHIHDMFDGKMKGIPTLSIVGFLNDDYEGGEFIMFDDMEIKLKQGDVLIFPSNFLYPHKVNPVTKGIRDSFVSWVW
jgi:predicted 2-oxoglutarate/Fe(II)-dependent dioxygenase YbiX